MLGLVVLLIGFWVLCLLFWGGGVVVSLFDKGFRGFKWVVLGYVVWNLYLGFELGLFGKWFFFYVVVYKWVVLKFSKFGSGECSLGMCIVGLYGIIEVGNY